MNTPSLARRRNFSMKILSWYAQHKRDLPWRATRDPYKILVSEVMLQQTQVSRVIPIYKAFLKRFPTLAALGNASLGDVIVAWKGLGYNRRAKLLWELARHENHSLLYGKQAKTDPSALLILPGIGHYTANAVAAFSWNADAAPVDTNIRRVHTRYFGRDTYTDALPAATLPNGRGRDWNNALMDFGSAVCTKQPRCSECPVRRSCVAYKTSTFTVTVPKQGAFKESNRFYRGQILNALRTGPKTRAQLASIGDAKKIDAALAQIEDEEFVIKKQSRYQLT